MQFDFGRLLPATQALSGGVGITLGVGTTQLLDLVVNQMNAGERILCLASAIVFNPGATTNWVIRVDPTGGSGTVVEQLHPEANLAIANATFGAVTIMGFYQVTVPGSKTFRFTGFSGNGAVQLQNGTAQIVVARFPNF